jgi:GntR family transcriptional regulator, trigonelline degradation regulator
VERIEPGVTCAPTQWDPDMRPADPGGADANEMLRVVRSNVTLRDQVLEKLKGAILDFRFRPGQRLIERELCDLMGVSRTSVREALRHLEAEGLVRSIPNRGPVVASVTADEARQLYEVRGALEAIAGRLFAERASNAQIEALSAVMGELRQAYASGDPRLILQTTARFYDAIFAGCGNEMIAQILRSLHARVTFLRATSLAAPSRLPHSLAEVERILQAVRTRDLDGVYEACREHVSRASMAALEVLSRQDTSEDGSA